MSGSPAAARNVGSQSWCWMISFETTPGGDLGRPADHLGDAEGTLPVRVLLAAERGHAAVGPGVHVRPVVGAVDDDRVLREAELVELVQQRTDDVVVVDHRVVVGRLPAAGLPDALGLRVGAEVHVGGVEPEEERGPCAGLAIDEVEPVLEDLVVDRLHPLLRQRPGVLDPLAAHAPVPLVLGVVVGVGRPRVQDAARAEALVEAREVLLRGPVGRLRLLLGVEVVEVAEELVEAVDGGQVLVEVTEVVLAELPGGIAERLEQLGDRDVLGLQADVDARHPDLAQPGPVDALAGDERRSAGGAALLAVGVGEAHALVRDPVDVRRAVAHQPVAVGAQVRDPDVIAPDDQDVRLLGVGQLGALLDDVRELRTPPWPGDGRRRITPRG